MIKKYTPQKFNNLKKFKSDFDRRKNYGGDWIKYRFKFLHYNGRCYTCGEKSSCVDHIRSFRQGKDKEWFWIKTNHMPMCSSCHSYVTAKFDREWTEEKYLEKLRWIEKSRQEKNLHFGIKIIPGEFGSK